MKRLLTLLALLPLLASAQDGDENVFTLGVSAGIDKNINAYRLNSNFDGNKFSSSSPNYNIALDFGVMATEKLRPRLELKYVQMGYEADWSNTSLSSTVEKSVVKLYNFNINAHLDYLLFNSAKVQLFVSPALKWEFNMQKECKNTKLDGTYNYKQYNDIIKENPDNILGGSVSAILKYNVTKHIGLTLTPEYTLFFSKFVSSNNDLYQRTSVNFGVEYKF